MTPAQVDLLLAAEHSLSAPTPSTRESGSMADLTHLASLARKRA